MKKLFSLISMLSMSMVVFAQGSLLATLSHDGNISVYYGATALKSAVEAAENGDVITLSSGQFNAINIDKAITLRGSGMSISTDSISRHEATIIQGDFTINITDSLEGRISMEGLYFGSIKYTGTLRNAQFVKCRFGSFLPSTNEALITNSSFIHCRIYDGYRQNTNSNAYFINSAVCNLRNPSSSSIEFDNCFVKFDSQYGRGYNSAQGGGKDYNYIGRVYNSYYKSCIIQTSHQRENESSIPDNCVAYNCVGLGSPNLFKNISSQNTTNTFVSNISDVFKNYSITTYDTYIKDIYTFELTDAAATMYLGTDGTQVGIYGGNLPYDENPTIPQITKCNVASKSTADGKLSVDIEVKAAEY